MPTRIAEAVPVLIFPGNPPIFHERHDFSYNSRVLLVWRQIQYEVSCRDQFFVSTNCETILGGILPGVPFLIDSRLPERIGHIKATISKVQTLVQPLGATANHDQLLSFQIISFIRELRGIHKFTFAQLG